MSYERTNTSRFLTQLLHSPVYRKAHRVDAIIQGVQRSLTGFVGREYIPTALLHYVEDDKGRNRLAVTALLNSNSSDPASCIQGALTRGTNIALQMCAENDLILFGVVPVQFTTNLSGLHITADAVPNLDWT